MVGIPPKAPLFAVFYQSAYWVLPCFSRGQVPLTLQQAKRVERPTGGAADVAKAAAFLSEGRKQVGDPLGHLDLWILSVVDPDVTGVATNARPFVPNPCRPDFLCARHDKPLSFRRRVS